MITRRTKIQLAIFLVITLVGCTFVGARYARIDRWFYDDTYTVTVHLAESGGIYDGASVTYRGVGIGQVGELSLTDDGVDVRLDIDKEHDHIPADAHAVVGNRSAVGEQYVELQPQSQSGPYLRDGSSIARDRTTTPIAVEKLLGDVSRTVSSVDKEALRTTVSELGVAFDGTGTDLQRIMDTTSSFLETADANFELTTRLLRESNTVLRTQVQQRGNLRSFARDFGLFTDTLVQSDQTIRELIENGSLGANQLAALLAETKVDLGDLLRDLVTTGRIVRKHLDGFNVVLSIYPYVVEGGFTVVSKSDTGLYDAHFGLVLTNQQPCHRGYEGTNRRTPQELETQPMNEDAHCAEPATESNARGAQNAPLPRAVPGAAKAPVAAFDPETGAVVWGAEARRLAGTVAGRPEADDASGERTDRKDSFSWLYLDQAVAGAQ